MNRIKSFFAALSAVFLLSTTSLSAQAVVNNNEPHSAVQVSFFPPLSTNGFHSGRYSNDFSFNILAGVSKNERAFAFGGLANIIKNDAEGFQFAGLVNYTGGEGCGVQIGGLTSIVRGNYKGVQFGGLFNTAGDVRGAQIGGLFNIARDDAEGFQFGGLFNKAGDVNGVQFAGLFNVAKNVHGVQFAGLVNVADHSDYPIGLVNIIKDGEMGIAVGYNEIGTASLTFRSGGRVLYGILGVGYNHKVENNKEAFGVTAGYGAHINILPWLRINNELTVESVVIDFKKSAFKAGYALLPAFRLGRFELFGGPSINFMQTDEPGMRKLFPSQSLWKKERASGRLQQVFIGWQVGLQVLF